MPRTKEQNSLIRAEKKQLIMDTALHLFAENGFESTSIDTIAKTAGISKGLLYTYFECKDDLLYQILISGMQTITDNFNPEMSVEEFLTSVEKTFDHIAENRNFYKLYTIISVQPKVSQNLVKMVGEKNFHNQSISFFKKHFGERAMEEIILYGTITKGYSIVATFSDQQNVFSVDILKKTILNFLRERYKNNIK